MLLNDAARMAKDAGCRAVQDVMDARQQSSPWGINEAWLQIAIAQELRREARTPQSLSWRIHDEYPESAILNVGSEDPHPIDIVVLHPLAVNDDPWGYCPALGAIEIKKGWGNLMGDAKRLERLAKSPACPRPDTPALKWVMLVALINGPNEGAVQNNDQRVNRVVGQFGLKSVLACKPKEAPRPATEINAVTDRWFDVVCYGRAI
jgi:hypothetical protein